MNNLFFNKFFIYILFFLPLSYSIGIAVTEFFLLILSFFFLIKNRDLIYFKNKISIYLILFSLYIALNSIFQITHSDLIISSIFHFRYLLFALSIFFILNYFDKNDENYKYLAPALFLFVLFILFDSLFQFYSGRNFFGNEIVKNRISGVFGSELILGGFLIKILPVYFLIVYQFNLSHKKKSLIFFLSLYCIVIYISGERTSFVLLLIFLFFLFLFLNNLRAVIFFSSIVLIFFISLVSMYEVGKSDPFNRIFVKTFNQITNNYFLEKGIRINDNINIKEDFKNSDEIKKNLKVFSRDHQGHYILAIDIFKKNKIFGNGPEGFRYHCRKIEYDSNIGMCSTHPHNITLQILSELGLVGLLFYLIGITYIIFNLYRLKKIKIENSDKFSFFVCSFGLLINIFPFLPSGSFFNNWSQIIIYYYVGLYLYKLNRVFYIK